MNNKIAIALTILLTGVLLPEGELAKHPDQVTTLAATKGAKEMRGMASWYGKKFQGRPTASGERYNTNALTAAHRTLKFGTKVKVTNLNNGRSVIVRINDRGPFTKGRIIDLSGAAANAIGMIKTGVAPVKIEILK
ncbi:MAG: septal ring lytic transglycosylase RlpA family protein [Prochloraceae cyanobacterium]|nr:septal ring lytic transglycosylase RlpA family protein [Prochloraceae cyanobacterium]